MSRQAPPSGKTRKGDALIGIGSVVAFFSTASMLAAGRVTSSLGIVIGALVLVAIGYLQRISASAEDR